MQNQEEKQSRSWGEEHGGIIASLGAFVVLGLLVGFAWFYGNS